MASVIEKVPVSSSEALAYALGVRLVSFGELPQAEGDDLLRTTLQNIDLRELRGFKPLRELLTFSPGSVVYGGARIHTLEVETLQLKEGVAFEEDAAADLTTHALPLCRRYIEMEPVFKRYESDEETGSWRTAHQWGQAAYHARGTTRSLVLRRPRNHTPAEANLLLVGATYEKVPREDRHVITSLIVTNPTLADLRVRYADSFAEVAIELLQQLKRAYAETVGELRYQLKQAQKVEAKLERIMGSLTA